MRILTLHVKREYFEAIQAGTKKEEYRLFNDHWRKRIECRNFDEVEICLGYPERGDSSRRLRFPWRGYEIKRIRHKHFESQAVTTVFAIRLESEAT